MPAIANRALLLELTAYLVDNNIRRNVLTAAVNVQAAEQDFYERSKTLQPGETWTFNSLQANKGTVIRSSNGSVNVALTKGVDTWTFKIDSLFTVTDEIGNIVFTNPANATKAVVVWIIQV